MHLLASPIIQVLPLLLLLPTTSAWGSLGHRTVAHLSSMHFTPQSTHFTNTLLNGQDISEAALFPDKVRHMPQFAYSAGWHYIDAHDDPPRVCGINMTRDCALSASGGCVVSAIANHTARVADPGLPMYLRGQSLRFMIHFFGDVHQPLHTEAEARGGNDLPVLFDGRHTNLHSVWDALIPNKYARGNDDGHEDEDELAAAWRWAQTLYAPDDNGASLDDECTHDAAQCSLDWAGEANAYVCSYVLAQDPRGLELGGEYYAGAVPIVNEMVQKAGRRLAAWINAIAAVDEYESSLLGQ